MVEEIVPVVAPHSIVGAPHSIVGALLGEPKEERYSWYVCVYGLPVS